MRVETAGAIPLLDFEPTGADFRAEFTAGLRRRPRHLPCKFFYNERGSALFDEICTLPEYYPTRTELRILEQHRTAIAAFCGPQCRLVELGSGSSRKTRLLLDHLECPAAYVPVDISRAQLLRTAAALAEEYPALAVQPVCADYAQSIRLPRSREPGRRKVLFFPGSTIGNFEPADAAAFLRRIATWCRPGDRLVIGADLAKPRERVEPAYNDSRGVTAAFNLNLLVRANEELGADFWVDQFSHRARYNQEQQRIEMFLVSGCEQSVQINGESFAFSADEPVLTEYSYKYDPRRFERMMMTAGWDPVQRWTDEQAWFGVFALELRK